MTAQNNNKIFYKGFQHQPAKTDLMKSICKLISTKLKCLSALKYVSNRNELNIFYLKLQSRTKIFGTR